MHQSLAAVTILVAIAFAPPLRAQRPELRAHIDAYVKALSSGSPDQFEAMAKDHFAPELLARSVEQRAQMVTRVHDDFGAMEIANATMPSPTHVDLEMRSATNAMPLTIAMDFEAQPPFRITQVGLRAGGPAGGRGGRGAPPPPPAVPVKASMSNTELAAALDGYLARAAGAGDFAGVVL